MRKTREMHNLFKSNLRSYLVAEPTASLRRLQLRFLDSGIRLDLEYISKLREEMLHERAHRMDRRTLNMIVAEYEDTILVIRDMAMQIAGTGFNPSVRMQAMGLIHRFSDSLFDRLLIAGALDKGQKRLMQAKPNKLQMLPSAKKQSILSSMFNLTLGEKQKTPQAN